MKGSGGKQLIRLSVAGYEAEMVLQGLLEDHP
jgi:hypothetical protein